MIASLPMYDFPELADATDRFWDGLRGHLEATGLAGVPDRLTHPVDLYAHWLSPQLLFTQTCGFPLTHALLGKVRYLATPSYLAPGCEGSSYCSLIIVREDGGVRSGGDLAGKVAAFNGEDSQSGFNALRLYLSCQGIAPGAIRGIESGSHRNSLRLVRDGKASFCAVDCVSWALVWAVAPAEVDGLRVLDRTQSAPCLPYVTGLQRSIADVAALRDGLVAAFADPALADSRRRLLLGGISVLDDSSYEVIRSQEASVRNAGWSRLA